MWIGLIVFATAMAGGYWLSDLFFSLFEGKERGTEGESIPDSDEHRIRELIEQGYTSKAVKIYAEVHQLGMMEAMEEIDKIERAMRAAAPPSTPPSTGELTEGSPEPLYSPVRSIPAGVPIPYETLAALLKEGRKIEAIKVYRSCTKASLKEAKEAVELLQKTGSQTPPPAGGGFFFTSTSEVIEDQAIFDLIRQGKKIEAIKLYRERTGAGLKVAKDAVDEIARTIEMASKV